VLGDEGSGLGFVIDLTHFLQQSQDAVVFGGHDGIARVVLRLTGRINRDVSFRDPALPSGVVFGFANQVGTAGHLQFAVGQDQPVRARLAFRQVVTAQRDRMAIA
jgi:hypothetical protein